MCVCSSLSALPPARSPLLLLLPNQPSAGGSHQMSLLLAKVSSSWKGVFPCQCCLFGSQVPDFCEAPGDNVDCDRHSFGGHKCEMNISTEFIWKYKCRSDKRVKGSINRWLRASAVERKTGISSAVNGDTLFLPVMHYIRDDGGEEAEQHDRRAGIHNRVQKLRRVSGERQHLLQILKQGQRKRETG